MSRTRRRRHLDKDQRAALGVDILPALEKEARERQGTSTGGANPQLVEIFPQADTSKSRDKAAAMVGVNPRYISNMKKLAAEEPELAEEIRSGDETIQAHEISRPC